MATRKKPRRPRKATSNSKIAEAQKATSEKRIEQDTLRGQAGAERARQATPNLRAPKKVTGDTPYAVVNGPAPKSDEGNQSLSDAAHLVAGLAAPVMKEKQAEAARQAEAAKQAVAAEGPRPLANPGLYGVSTAKRASNLTDLMAANADADTKALKSKGNAVYMGPTATNQKIRNSGPERFNDDGSTTTPQSTGETVVNKDTLLSWLSDETKVAQIKDAANKAGLAVSTYDDISKLWSSVVSQAASSFSLAGQRVTPWALIQLRGKYAVNGTTPDKVTTSTSIEEMDPATARSMFEKTVQDQLGRAPTKAELDDFIAKAQTIAQQNPAVTTTTSKIGFDGNVTDQISQTKGGASVVNDKAQMAAVDQAKQSEDYAAYQAAGNYFPMLFQALQAPV